MPHGRPLSCPWTDESLAVEALRLRDMEGLSNAKIAMRLGRGITRNAVIGKLLRLDVAAGRIKPKRPVKTEQERRVSARLSKERHRQTTKLHRPRNHAPTPPRQVAVAPPAAATSATNASILAVAYGQCRYIIGEPAGPATLMCGGPVKGGLGSWCPHHFHRVSQPAKPRHAAAKLVPALAF